MNKYLEDEKGFTDTCVYTRVSDISDRVFNFQIIIKYFITCNTYLVYTGYLVGINSTFTKFTDDIYISTKNLFFHMKSGSSSWIFDIQK